MNAASFRYMLRAFALLAAALPLVAQESDLEKAKAEMQRQLGDDYTYETIEGIFALACNGDDEILENSRGTVKQMFSAIYKEFAEKKPEKPLKVYCFKDKESYESFVRDTLKRKVTTPYGFYLSGKRSLVMNIATGTGTLAHELVHPFLEADFENVPSWFNEGFASLFEQSRHTRDGKQRGLPNWRLPGLQKAIKNETCPKLSDLMKTTTDEFYDSEKSGVNYALARYFCYYMQEKGVLKDFYKKFRDGFKDDKPGIKTAEEVLGKPIDDIESDLQKFVMKLKYP